MVIKNIKKEIKYWNFNLYKKEYQKTLENKFMNFYHVVILLKKNFNQKTFYIKKL